MQVSSWTIILIYIETIVLIHALQNIFKDLKLNQAVIFTDYEKNSSSKYDCLYEKIFSHFSATSINFLKINQTGNNQTLQMKNFQNPRQSSIYVIIHGINSEKSKPRKINNILNKLVEISPIKMRPKCLILHFDHNNFLPSEAEEILQYGWSLKFLDLTILRINSCNALIDYFNYNPFKKTFNTGYLKNKNDLFPDKLVDVNKYPLKIPVFQFPPYLSFRIKNGSVVNVKGEKYYKYLKTVAENFNFKLSFIVIETPQKFN